MTDLANEIDLEKQYLMERPPTPNTNLSLATLNATLVIVGLKASNFPLTKQGFMFNV